MKKQKGFISSKGFGGFIITLMVISAIVGWGFIEGIIWIASHISIGWV